MVDIQAAVERAMKADLLAAQDYEDPDDEE